jgi:hypothetical protein
MRKDTGFFNLKADSEGAFKSVLKNLSAEDFIGEIVQTADGFFAVTSASDNAARTTVTFTAGEATYTYTRATGAIAVVTEGGSGGEG